jgi:hypothetical protein
MRASGIACIIILILSILLAAAIWYIVSREDIEQALEDFRLKRSIKNAEATSKATTIDGLDSIQAEEKRNQINEKENLFTVALGKRLITCPEDIMKSFEDDNFECKEINRTLNIFKRNYNNDFGTDNVYSRLFRSLNKFHHLLCGENERYRQLFMPLQDEFVKIHEELEDCKGQLDWYEKDNTTACVEAQKIVDCYYEPIYIEMGGKIAYHYIHVYKKVINAAMTTPCKFKRLEKNMTFENLESASNIQLASRFTIIICLFSSILLLYILD